MEYNCLQLCIINPYTALCSKVKHAFEDRGSIKMYEGEIKMFWSGQHSLLQSSYIKHSVWNVTII